MQNLAEIVFALSVTGIVYAILGYPLVLAALARMRGDGTESQGWVPRTVTVLLAVHNGEAWISRKLESLLALDYPRELVQILVLDDGSTDATAELVKAVPDSRIALVTLARGGKARAINAGLARATGEIVFFTDVRQALHPQSLRRLVERFADPGVGVVSGELVIRAADQEEEAAGLYWKYEKWVRRQQSRAAAMTGATGSIYAMRRDLAAVLPPDTLVDDMYLPLAAVARGSQIVFEPEAKAYDSGTTPGEEFRRKVRTLAGNVQIIPVLAALFPPFSRVWFHFVSHKVARLLLPYACLLAAASGVAAASPLRELTLVLGGTFSLLAGLDPWVPASWRIKRPFSLARMVALLLLAAACAPFAIRLGRAALWQPSRARVPVMVSSSRVRA